MTTVVSVRGRSRDYAALMADPSFAYVGRSVRYTPWTASDWGNPFAGPGAVERFESHLRGRADLMARLGELRGKVLGCWCGEWRPGDPDIGCHAVVLACLAEGLETLA